MCFRYATRENSAETVDGILEDLTLVREAVAVFHSAEDLQNAMGELLQPEFLGTGLLFGGS